MIAFRIGVAALVAFAGAQSAAAQTLIVGNKSEDTISLIDYASGQERARLPTGPQPHEATLSPDGARAAVVAYGGESIDIVDIAAAQIVERIQLPRGARPHGLVWLADGRLIATAEGIASLLVLDASGGLRVIALDQARSHMLAVSPDGGTAYVSNVNAGTVSVVDLRAGVATRVLQAGAAPEGIALSPDGAVLWVAERDGGHVRAFDTRTLRQIARIPVGERPIRMLVTPDGAYAITSNFVDGALTLIDTARMEVVGTIQVAEAPGANLVTIIFSRGGEAVLAAETGFDTIAEIDLATRSVIRRFQAGSRGDGLALSPINVAP